MSRDSNFLKSCVTVLIDVPVLRLVYYQVIIRHGSNASRESNVGKDDFRTKVLNDFKEGDFSGLCNNVDRLLNKLTFAKL